MTPGEITPNDRPQTSASTWRPQTKVVVGGIGGAAATIVVWILTSAGLEVPDAVATAIGALATAGLAYLIPQGGQ
jgi:putative flippase GtrA